MSMTAAVEWRETRSLDAWVFQDGQHKVWIFQHLDLWREHGWPGSMPGESWRGDNCVSNPACLARSWLRFVVDVVVCIKDSGREAKATRELAGHATQCG